MHCTMKYPCPDDMCHLKVIPELKEKFHCSVGYSSHNPSILPGAPIVNRIAYSLWLNGIKMAEGSTGLPLIIWSGETKSVVFTTKLDQARIKRWWVSHIKSDERTSYQFKYTLFARLLGVTLVQWPGEIEGAFETDLLARKPL